MGLKGCEITLDNPWSTYYAGQTVNGKVNFTFDSPKKIRGKLVEILWVLIGRGLLSVSYLSCFCMFYLNVCAVDVCVNV